MSRTSLDDMMVFCVVAEEKSFSKAARRLDLGRARISQIISRLEHSLGARLLNRTTRSLSLTIEGQQYFQQCLHIRDLALEANSKMQGDHLQGLIRIAAPAGLDFVADALADFFLDHPTVQLELIESDQVSHLIDQNIDVAIRSGPLDDSSFKAIKIFEFDDILCASAAYLDQFPEFNLSDPASLLSMRWIRHVKDVGGQYLTLKSPDGQVTTLKHPPAITAGSVQTLKSFIQKGLGFGFMPTFAIQEELKAGQIRQIEAGQHRISVPLFAVYPDQHHMPLRLRRLLDHLRDYVF